MARQIKTAPFGLQPVPMGRQKEAVASIPADLQPRVGVVEGSGLGDGARYFLFADREALGRQIRKEEASAFLGRTKHRALVPLKDGEGYSRPSQKAVA